MPMLHKLSVKLSELLVQAGMNPEFKAHYAYGAECTLGTAIVLIVLFLYAIIAKQCLYMLVYIIAWLPLRVFVGGAHAHTHIGCNLTSIGLGILSVAFTEYLHKIPIYIMLPITAVCYIVFFIVAPVIHKNHPVSDERIKRMRRFARIYSAVIGIVLCLCCIIHTKYRVPVFMAYLTTAISAVIGYFSKSRLKT